MWVLFGGITMEYTKSLRICCLLLLISVFLGGCKSPLVAYRYPGSQPNSVWSTKDGTVVFYIGDEKNDRIYGVIKTADSTVDIGIFMSDLVSLVDFYYAEDMRNWDNNNLPQSFAYGHGKVISKKEYQIEITSADAFFEAGQILTFYKTQEKTD